MNRTELTEPIDGESCRQVYGNAIHTAPRAGGSVARDGCGRGSVERTWNVDVVRPVSGGSHDR